MPPLIAAILLGAGAYAGLRVARRLWTQMLDTPDTAEAPVQSRAEGAAAKDLGPLELDPKTGVYRPTRQN